MKKTPFEKRRERVRTKLKLVQGDRLRLTVHRTNKHMYVQLIDDKAAKTVAAASTVEKDLRSQFKNGGTKEAAEAVGKAIAQKASKLGIEKVIFDRSGLLFHGRVKSLAEAARSGGLNF